MLTQSLQLDAFLAEMDSRHRTHSHLNKFAAFSYERMFLVFFFLVKFGHVTWVLVAH